MKMKFIGANNSMGYIKNKVYDVKIETHKDKIILKCFGHIPCPYSSFKTLLANWQEITK